MIATMVAILVAILAGCGVRDVVCGMWCAELRNEECGVRDVMCGMWCAE